MEATTTNKRLHPLLVTAAISVTVFSAVGVAAITGLIPNSRGSSAPAATVAAIPEEVAKPVEPAISHPVEPRVEAPQPIEQPKPIVKHKKVAKAPAPVAPAPVPADLPLPPAAASTPPPPPPAVVAQAPEVQAPKPVPAGQVGTVESVREITVPGKTQGVGAVGGAVLGGVLGNTIGRSTGGKSIVTVLGAVGGGLAGNELEKRGRGTKQWEIAVRFDDGSTRTVTSTNEPFWHTGDRVRLLNGNLQPV
jgi:outer membrane lipoprotein SlyB